MKTTGGVMRRTIGALTLVFAPTMVSADSILHQYNVFTSGNLTENSHVNLNTWVGGDLTGSGAVFSMVGSPNAVGLTVAGSVSGSNIQVNSGKNAVITNNADAGNLHMNGGAVLAPTPGLVAQSAAMTSELAASSSAFAALLANQAAPLLIGGQMMFTVSAATAVNGVAVFSIDGSMLGDSTYQNGFGLAGDYASIGGIIINVTGTSVESKYNFNGNWGNDASVRTKTLWNFQDATSLKLAGNFYGAILAIHADVTQGSTSIDSSVFAKSLTSNGEIHGPLYNGFVPNAVPEPTSVVMGATALVFAAGFARRRASNRV